MTVLDQKVDRLQKLLTSNFRIRPELSSKVLASGNANLYVKERVDLFKSLIKREWVRLNHILVFCGKDLYNTLDIPDIGTGHKLFKSMKMVGIKFRGMVCSHWPGW